jgi:superfamily I DNA/RNA helicase
MNPVAEAPTSALDISQLEGIQEEVVTLKPEGHAVILGGSGTGKTVLSVLRALYLSDPEAEHSGRTLLVTYNKSLLAYLNHLIPPGTKCLEASTYHHFALAYLEKCGKMKKDWTIRDLRELSLIKEAREEVRKASSEETGVDLKQSVFVLKPELDWIAQNGFASEESYLSADRTGRGGPMPQKALEALFHVYETYRRLRSEAGQEYSWEDMPAAVRSALKQDESERRYRHIVIDEGQDFSPEMLRSLALAIPENGSLTFFGDLAQQIYCRGVSWRSAGLNVSKVWELTENHRNSRQIAELASAIADMPYFNEQADVVRAEALAPPGPKPRLVTFASHEDEDAFVVERGEELAADGSVAVLCRRYEDAARIGKQFEEAKGLNRFLGTWHPGPGVWCGTVHSAKGYEFDSVILVGVTMSKWPEPRAISGLGPEQAAAADGRLLYVGVSRARQNLIITTTGAPTALLPPNEDLWLEEHRGPTAELDDPLADSADDGAGDETHTAEQKDLPGEDDIVDEADLVDEDHTDDEPPEGTGDREDDGESPEGTGDPEDTRSWPLCVMNLDL